MKYILIIIGIICILSGIFTIKKTVIYEVGKYLKECEGNYYLRIERNSGTIDIIPLGTAYNLTASWDYVIINGHHIPRTVKWRLELRK